MRNYKLNRVLVAALLVIGNLAISPNLEAAVTNSRQVSKVLSNSKNLAYELQDDAALMESYTKLPELSWQSHVQAINEIGLDLGDLALQVRKLDDAREVASPWQKSAIDEIHPLLMTIGMNDQKIVDDLNANSKVMNNPDYQQYLEANYYDVARLAALISDYVEYGKTIQKMEQVTRLLHLR